MDFSSQKDTLEQEHQMDIWIWSILQKGHNLNHDRDSLEHTTPVTTHFSSIVSRYQINLFNLNKPPSFISNWELASSVFSANEDTVAWDGWFCY